MSVLGGDLGNYQVVGNLQQQQEEAQQKTQEQIEKEEKDRLRIHCDKKFPDLIATAYSDTIKFPKEINAMFRTVFADWHGSRMEVVQNRQLFTTIHFHEIPEGSVPKDQYRGIERIIDKNSLRNSDSRIDALNHMASFGHRNLYRLTNEAKQMLKDVVPVQFINHKNGSVDWNKVVSEGSVQAENGYGTVAILQIVVDINRVLKLMYGDKSDDDGDFQYMVNVGNPINPVPSPAGLITNQWQLFIMRCNTKDVRYLASEYGFRFGNNNGIITD